MAKVLECKKYCFLQQLKFLLQGEQPNLLDTSGVAVAPSLLVRVREASVSFSRCFSSPSEQFGDEGDSVLVVAFNLFEYGTLLPSKQHLQGKRGIIKPFTGRRGFLPASLASQL